MHFRQSRLTRYAYIQQLLADGEVNIVDYNPPINFRVILLATLRHVVLIPRTDITQ